MRTMIPVMVNTRPFHLGFSKQNKSNPIMKLPPPNKRSKQQHKSMPEFQIFLAEGSWENPDQTKNPKSAIKTTPTNNNSGGHSLRISLVRRLEDLMRNLLYPYSFIRSLHTVCHPHAKSSYQNCSNPEPASSFFLFLSELSNSP